MRKILTNRPNSTTVEAVTVFREQPTCRPATATAYLCCQRIQHSSCIQTHKGDRQGAFQKLFWVVTPKWQSRTSFESRSSGLNDRILCLAMRKNLENNAR